MSVLWVDNPKVKSMWASQFTADTFVIQLEDEWTYEGERCFHASTDEEFDRKLAACSPNTTTIKKETTMYYVINESNGEVDEFSTSSSVELYIEEQVNDYDEDIDHFKVVEGDERDVECQVKVVIS